MIQELMSLALSARLVVIFGAILLAVAGIYSFTQVDIEAYPDPVQPMTEVLTLPSGLMVARSTRATRARASMATASSPIAAKPSTWRCAALAWATRW